LRMPSLGGACFTSTPDASMSKSAVSLAPFIALV
jgi:hypothetical protein